MSKYYYHGIRNGLVLDKILNIFKDKGITSKRLQHNLCNSGFNGLDYISICKKEEESLYHKFPNNAFYNYVQDHFCFILTDDLDVIKPEIIPDAKSWNRFELINYFNSKPGMQFSDMFDEWQVKDYIPLSKIIGIGIPVANLKSIFLTGTMYSSETSRESLDILKKIIFLANELKLDIIDSSELDFVTKYENQKELQQTIEFKLNI